MIELVSKRTSRIIKLLNDGRVDEGTRELRLLIDSSGDIKSPRVHFDKLVRAIDLKYGLNVFEAQPSDEETARGQRHETRIYVVTPSFNSAATINRTIESVVTQSGRFTLHYHVQDGGSSDGTLRILEDWKDRLANAGTQQTLPRVEFSYSSEADEGMYDAIRNGFDHLLAGDVSGRSWMTWINSDDQLVPGAFQYLADIDDWKNSGWVNWLTGMQSVRYEDGHCGVYMPPHCSELISRGLCDGEHWWFIQQEGTFWRKAIWDELDPDRIWEEHKYAGDWRLWFEISRTQKLFYAQRPLGIFNIRRGQLSQTSMGKYREEIASICSPEARKSEFEKVKGSCAEVFELVQVQLTGDFVLTKRPVLIEGKRTVAGKDTISSWRNVNATPDADQSKVAG